MSADVVAGTNSTPAGIPIWGMVKKETLFSDTAWNRNGSIVLQLKYKAAQLGCGAALRRGGPGARDLPD